MRHWIYMNTLAQAVCCYEAAFLCRSVNIITTWAHTSYTITIFYYSMRVFRSELSNDSYYCYWCHSDNSFHVTYKRAHHTCSSPINRISFRIIINLDASEIYLLSILFVRGSKYKKNSSFVSFDFLRKKFRRYKRYRWHFPIFCKFLSFSPIIIESFPCHLDKRASISIDDWTRTCTSKRFCRNVINRNLPYINALKEKQTWITSPTYIQTWRLMFRIVCMHDVLVSCASRHLFDVLVGFFGNGPKLTIRTLNVKWAKMLSTLHRALSRSWCATTIR